MSRIIIVSGPVIVRDNKVLLDIQGDDDFWKFCGGKIKENESLGETAKRRAKEELGIDIKIEATDPYVFYTEKESDNEPHEVVVAHFLASFAGDIRPGAEVKRWDWFGINDLPKNLAPSVLPTLKYFGFVK